MEANGPSGAPSPPTLEPAIMEGASAQPARVVVSLCSEESWSDMVSLAAAQAMIPTVVEGGLCTEGGGGQLQDRDATYGCLEDGTGGLCSLDPSSSAASLTASQAANTHSPPKAAVTDVVNSFSLGSQNLWHCHEHAIANSSSEGTGLTTLAGLDNLAAKEGGGTREPGHLQPQLGHPQLSLTAVDIPAADADTGTARNAQLQSEPLEITVVTNVNQEMANDVSSSFVNLLQDDGGEDEVLMLSGIALSQGSQPCSHLQNEQLVPLVQSKNKKQFMVSVQDQGQLMRIDNEKGGLVFTTLSVSNDPSSSHGVDMEMLAQSEQYLVSISHLDAVSNTGNQEEFISDINPGCSEGVDSVAMGTDTNVAEQRAISVLTEMLRPRLHPGSPGDQVSALLSADHTYPLPQRPCVCGACGSSWANLENLLFHIDSHAEADSFTCHFCDDKLSGLTSYRSHLEAHKSGRQFLCHLCRREYLAFSSLYTHYHLQHGLYLCQACYKVFPGRSLLAKHRRKEHMGKCAKGSLDENTVEVDHRGKHLKLQLSHSRVKSGAEQHHLKLAGHQRQRIMCSTSAIKCHVCLQYFPSVSQLVNHKNTGACLPAVQCSTCKKKFSSADDLNSHHCKEEELHICSQCGKSFKYRWSLSNHEVLHRREPQSYGCSQCGRQFTSRHDLCRHDKTHSGEKPFSCDLCQMRFAVLSGQNWKKLDDNWGNRNAGKDYSKNQLIRHSRLHTGDYLHQCSICRKPFPQKSHLDAHMRIHNGVQPFKCTVCDRHFRQKSSMKRHLLTHSENKPFSCSMCSKKFNQNTALKRHLMTHRKRQTGADQHPELIVPSGGIHASQDVGELGPGGHGDGGAVETGSLITGQQGGSLTGQAQCSYCRQVFEKEAFLLSHLKDHCSRKPPNPAANVPQDPLGELLADQMATETSNRVLVVEETGDQDTIGRKFEEEVAKLVGLHADDFSVSSSTEALASSEKYIPMVVTETATMMEPTSELPGITTAPVVTEDPEAPTMTTAGDQSMPFTKLSTQSAVAAGGSDQSIPRMGAAVLSGHQPALVAPVPVLCVEQQDTESGGPVRSQDLSESTSAPSLQRGDQSASTETPSVLTGNQSTSAAPSLLNEDQTISVSAPSLPSGDQQIILLPVPEDEEQELRVQVFNSETKKIVSECVDMPVAADDVVAGSDMTCSIPSGVTYQNQMVKDALVPVIDADLLSHMKCSSPEEKPIHVSRSHNIIKTRSCKKEPDTSMPSCDICFKVFKTRSHLELHKTLHSDGKPFKCSNCDKSYMKSADLTVHMRLHTGERPYSCQECGKTFTSTGTLQKHTFLHTGIKRHVCEVCGKGYPRMNQLTLHMSSRHTGHRPFVCDVCDKGFTDKSGLNRHKRTHKTYYGSCCLYTFT